MSDNLRSTASTVRGLRTRHANGHLSTASLVRGLRTAAQRLDDRAVRLRASNTRPLYWEAVRLETEAAHLRAEAGRIEAGAAVTP